VGNDHGGTGKLWLGNIHDLIAVFRFHQPTMDDIFELPNADVSKLQERGQSEGPDDGNSSADEEEGGLDWTKLPYVFPLFFHPMLYESRARPAGLALPSPGRLFRNVGTKSMSPHQGPDSRNITSRGLVLRCSMP